MRRSFLFLLLLVTAFGVGFWVPTQNQALFHGVGKAEVRNLNVSSGQKIQSLFTLTGEARGAWFFEASLPVTLYDAHGKVIAQAPAQALTDWMTADFVPFSVNLIFSTPATRTGEISIRADNPSGEPANDKEFRVPVIF